MQLVNFCGSSQRLHQAANLRSDALLVAMQRPATYFGHPPSLPTPSELSQVRPWPCPAVSRWNTCKGNPHKRELLEETLPSSICWMMRG